MPNQSVWEQIDEENEDYQYFKDQDTAELQKTLEAMKKEHGIENS